MKKIITLLCIMLPSLVLAHPGHEGISVEQGVLAGLLHPLMGLDHLLAFAALGVLLFKVNAKQSIVIGASFLAMLAVGFYGAQLGLLNVSSALVETMILLSVGCSVGFVLISKWMKASLSAMLVTGFAVFHGIAHGLEVPVGASSHGFALGFLISCLALMVMARISFATVAHLSPAARTQA